MLLLDQKAQEISETSKESIWALIKLKYLVSNSMNDLQNHSEINRLCKTHNIQQKHLNKIY